MGPDCQSTDDKSGFHGVLFQMISAKHTALTEIVDTSKTGYAAGHTHSKSSVTETASWNTEPQKPSCMFPGCVHETRITADDVWFTTFQPCRRHKRLES